MNESKAFRVATAWRARFDDQRSLPIKKAVAIIEAAWAERRDPAPALAAARAEARAADHARDEYVARLALAIRAQHAAMSRRPNRDEPTTSDANAPRFEQVWTLGRWMAGRRRAA